MPRDPQPPDEKRERTRGAEVEDAPPARDASADVEHERQPEEERPAPREDKSDFH